MGEVALADEQIRKHAASIVVHDVCDLSSFPWTHGRVIWMAGHILAHVAFPVFPGEVWEVWVQMGEHLENLHVRVRNVLQNTFVKTKLTYNSPAAPIFMSRSS